MQCVLTYLTFRCFSRPFSVSRMVMKDYIDIIFIGVTPEICNARLVDALPDSVANENKCP
jgi:hypothetical protein